MFKSILNKSKNTRTTLKKEPERKSFTIEKDIEKNIFLLKKALGKNDDVVLREFETFINKPVKVFLCYMSTLATSEYINQFVVKPLLEPNFINTNNSVLNEGMIQVIKNKVLDVGSLSNVSSDRDILTGILSGKAALFIDGYNTVLMIEVQGFPSRNVTEPDTESVVRGPREGFTESIEVNTGLIRRKIINPNLVFEKFTIGANTHTKIRIAYIEGIAENGIVDEVKNRLHKIDIGTVLESGYIEQLIEDHPFSIFPTIGNTEKPDITAAKLLEGKVAILCDGTPFVLTVPSLFIEKLHNSEDYYARSYFTSMIRLLRLLALFITITIPAFYVALTSYHQAMLPTILLSSMAAAEENVPFPVFIETILIGTAFEILKEAGVRLPRPIGSAVSIVGALIIGEGAVQAGLVSAPMVIAMALTGIAGFIVPAINDAVVMARLFLVLLAGVLGLYGILLGCLIILTHMCSLHSFGEPYLRPLAPIKLRELKDSLIRMPLWKKNVVLQSSKRNKE